MQFVAIKTGFFGGSLVNPGASFEAPDNFKASWAVPAESKAAKAAKPAKAEKPAPKALSEVAASGKSFVDVHAEKGDEGLA